jgi:hypothetical protein
MRNTICDSAPPIEEDVLFGVEERLGLVLPDDYRAFLGMHNGGVPRPDWIRLRRPSPVRSQGSLRWFGQKYGNESLRERRCDWHRVLRFLGVVAGGEGAQRHADFERAYQDRSPGWPAHLAPVTCVQEFDRDGWLCLDVSPDRPGRGRVFFWADAGPSTENFEPVPVANSFEAVMELLGYPGERPPE